MTALEAGQRLRELRTASDFTLTELSRASGISAPHIGRVELGLRGSRRSTLVRLATALVALNPEIGDSAGITAELIDLAGDELVPESAWESTRARHAARWRERAEDVAVVRRARDARLLGEAVDEIRRTDDLSALDAVLEVLSARDRAVTDAALERAAEAIAARLRTDDQEND